MASINLNLSDTDHAITIQDQNEIKRKSFRHNRQYSLVIAENVIESPSERHNRDHKNNNIWTIRDLDVRQKPEHDFGEGASPGKEFCSVDSS